MNAFGFRVIKTNGMYRPEYRLAHWSGFRPVIDDRGREVLLAQPAEAHMRAAHELVRQLNGDQRFWAGSTGSEAREAAERLFARAHGKSEEAGA